jgi:hypothetical protein
VAAGSTPKSSTNRGLYCSFFGKKTMPYSPKIRGQIAQPPCEMLSISWERCDRRDVTVIISCPGFQPPPSTLAQHGGDRLTERRLIGRVENAEPLEDEILFKGSENRLNRRWL